MGGSGTTNLALRRADRIAFAAGSVGVHVPGSSPQFTNSYIQSYGPLEWRLPFMDGKTAAFDYFSNVWYLKHHRPRACRSWCSPTARTTADRLAAGPRLLPRHAGNPAAARVLLGIERARAGPEVAGRAGRSGRRQGLSMDVRSDRTLPAFTCCSLDDKPGTAKRGPRPYEDRIVPRLRRRKRKKAANDARWTRSTATRSARQTPILLGNRRRPDR